MLQQTNLVFITIFFVSFIKSSWVNVYQKNYNLEKIEKQWKTHRVSLHFIDPDSNKFKLIGLRPH